MIKNLGPDKPKIMNAVTFRTRSAECVVEHVRYVGGSKLGGGGILRDVRI